MCSWSTSLSLGLFGCASPPADGGLAGDGDSGDGDGYDGAPDPARCMADGDTPAQPFGSHALAYEGAHILPSGAATDLDAKVSAHYDAWKARYIGRACGEDEAYVVADIEGETEQLQTVSEAHGYGMLITVFMAGHDPEAKTLFDGMVRYFRAHPSSGSRNLMAWAQNYECNNAEGDSSASDGDLDIAYALLLADRQWGSGGAIDYRSEARAVIEAIWDETTDPSHRYMLLGDWVTPGSKYGNATRSSDFMPAHFEAFAWATGDDRWRELASHGYAMLETLQNDHAADTGLLPDFVSNAGGDTPSPAEPGFLEGQYDGAYSYNACRDPWRIGMHYLATGDARAKALLERLNGWIERSTGGAPENIRAGYALDGSPLREFPSKAFSMPLAVSAMVDPSHQAWLDALWQSADGRDEVYFSDTLQLLAMIALSGNWWTPEAAPCPETP